MQNRWETIQVLEIPFYLRNENLDRGEKEAIILAISKNALLLMDEEKGRIFARSKNLRIKGSLGVLVEAFKRHLINEDQMRLYFQQISDREDIWINPELCDRLLKKLF
jgi:predicted nucleic acid-binding protein